ncbi:MopE-related protein, partial [Thermodesulfobacteriota bacterium]
CQPGDPNNFPGNSEICDCLDNNCNGQADDGLTFDNDGDGYTAIGSCGGSGDDCNDNNANIHPFGEFVGDGIDQDCDGKDLVNAVESTCIGCHGLESVNGVSTNPFLNYHVSVSAPDGTCVDCHAEQINAVLPGHYGQTVRTLGNNMDPGDTIGCNSCHDQVSDEHDFGANIVAAKIAADWPNVTCDTCHETRADDHATDSAHDNRIIDNSCGVCHTSDTSILGQPGSGTLTTQADVDTLHGNDCALCHAYTGTKVCVNTVEQAIEDGINGTDITCLDCHSGSAHHSPETNQVSYNQLVDTSQSPPQGCAVCHYDYDIANGTSLGLSTWETILVEHDLDGTKDGSSNACGTCHTSPRQEVQDVIDSNSPTTCADCHSDKVPDIPHGIPTTGKHPEHLDMFNVSCSTCHLSPPYFKSGTDSNGDGLYDLAETDVCYLCHQDGSGTPASDEFKDGWHDPDFVLACNSCHALPPNTGTHLTHYNGTDSSLVYGDLRITEDFTAGQVSTVNMIGCGNCHPTDTVSHGNQTWGDVELAVTGGPTGYLKDLSVNGSYSYDPVTEIGTCSNVYCHSVNSWTTTGPVPMPWPEADGWDKDVDGLPRPLPDNIVTVRAYQDVTWNTGETLTCSGCHGNPPQTSAADNDGGAGDSHYWVDSNGYENLHVYNMFFEPIGCRTCHYDTVQEWDDTQGVGWDEDSGFSPPRRYYNDVDIYDKAKHVNGTVDVVFDTVNDYTYFPSWNPQTGITYELDSSSFDPESKTCSNVGCHIQETAVTWGLPYRWNENTECDRCHEATGAPFGSACYDCHAHGREPLF